MGEVGGMDVKLVVTRNMLKLAAIISITATVMYSLTTIGLGAFFMKDVILQLVSIQSGTLVSLCGIEAYVDRKNHVVEEKDSR